MGLLLALAPFLGLTAFTQPFFDDFRNAYWAREHGIWGVQSWLFQTWTGRFTSTFFMAALNPVTYGWLNGVKVVAAGFFVALWGSIAYFIRTLLRTILRQPYLWGPAVWAAALLLQALAARASRPCAAASPRRCQVCRKPTARGSIKA